MDINTKILKEKSRYMSLLLRHTPWVENLEMNIEGYVLVVQLCNNLKLTICELDWIVDTNGKKRFAYNSDKTLIRASQGHSLDFVNIKYPEAIITCNLFHGTPTENKDSILKNGIKKIKRLVHLSKDIETATQVGKRKTGDCVIFLIDAIQMKKDGVKIFISDNGVYLTDFVDPKYIKLIS